MVKETIYVIIIYLSFSDFTSCIQVNVRPSRGIDLQKWLRVTVLSPKDIVPGPMGRKVEMERFELTTEWMNSEKLKE